MSGERGDWRALVVFGVLAIASVFLGMWAKYVVTGGVETPYDEIVAPARITVAALDGNAMDLRLKESPYQYLFFVLSVDCRYCDQNLPNWRELLRRVREDASRSSVVKPVVLSRSGPEETREYLNKHALDVAAFLIDGDAFRAVGAKGFPTTIVQSTSAPDLRIWRGVLSPAARRAVLEALETDSGSTPR